ncbi:MULTISPECIES: chemotaxis protein CheW [Cupriavidus]|uniref:Chemotaxis protein CheW n=2 Tax=Cupriavidus TaxID=106589 RepID=A0A1U9UV31_CUPNE|nr:MULTISPECIES: chemotaxis protein CheW [Cupriavidus]AQV96510.1 chemotaxis protein CheW [Cupriavidus necator]RDK07471.1 chemotaxis protein CheW [Cupriavidus lacunae]
MKHIDKADGTVEEFLAFTLGREEYGVDILKVQEIRGYESVTQIANAPDYIKGVINLRGIIVPIIDLRIKFRQPNVSYDQYTVVIIVDLNDRTTGIVVDGVSDVLTLTAAQIKPTPHFTGEVATDYIRGLGSVEQRMLILVDIEKLLNTEELAALEAVS